MRPSLAALLPLTALATADGSLRRGVGSFDGDVIVKTKDRRLELKTCPTRIGLRVDEIGCNEACGIDIQKGAASYDAQFEAPVGSGKWWSAHALVDAVDYGGERPLVFLKPEGHKVELVAPEGGSATLVPKFSGSCALLGTGTKIFAGFYEIACNWKVGTGRQPPSNSGTARFVVSIPASKASLASSGGSLYYNEPRMATVQRLAGSLQQSSTPFVVGDTTYTYGKADAIDVANYAADGALHNGCFLTGCSDLKVGAIVTRVADGTVIKDEDWAIRCPGVDTSFHAFNCLAGLVCVISIRQSSGAGGTGLMTDAQFAVTVLT
jgi:hypothetical protein